ncbi:MAG: hypothetical protein E7361_00400 [Clostridiales bacterium]|nr:hypothetical protein [Clostridiales bacterium]
MNKKIFGSCAFAMLLCGSMTIAGCDGMGTPGKSAYDLAVENGFTGTVEEWLESLKGESVSPPTIEINENGYWVINGTATTVKATGPVGADGATIHTGSGEPTVTGKNGDIYIDLTNYNLYIKISGAWDLQGCIKGTSTNGETPEIGENGNWWIGTQDTGVKAEGTDGQTPEVGPNGNWWIGTEDKGVLAIGKNGSAWIVDSGAPDADTVAKEGDLYLDSNTYNLYVLKDDTWTQLCCIKGTVGDDGDTPEIGDNGNWWIGTQDTGVKAKGADGKNGETPEIGDNGNWWIGNQDTGVKAEAQNGTSWIVDSGAPDADTVAKEGDLYLDSNTYNLYVLKNDTWTQLCCIKGTNGTDGKDVELAVNNGTIQWRYTSGTDTEWKDIIAISQLTGKEGTDGKEVEIQATSTHIQWRYTTGTDTEWKDIVDLNTLKGSSGSAWITNAGNPSNDLGNNGDMYLNTENYEIFKKVDGAWESVGNIKGKDGVSAPTIVDIEISYEYDNDGTMYVIYTFIMSEGDPIIKRAEMPNRVTSIGFIDSRFAIANDGSIPEMYIYVYYENGEPERVQITEDMIVVDEENEYPEIDFSIQGDYDIMIEYKGQTTYQHITLYDPNNLQTTGIHSNTSKTIWEVNDGVITENYIGINIIANYNDGRGFEITDDVTFSHNFDIDSYNSGQHEFTITAEYEGYETNITILAVDSIKETLSNGNYTLEYANTYYNSDICAPIQSNIDEYLDGDYIEYCVRENENHLYVYQPITADMLISEEDQTAIDTTDEKKATYVIDTAKAYFENENIRNITYDITIYNEANLEYSGASISNNEYKVTTDESIPEIYVNFDYTSTSLEGATITKQIKLTKEMLVNQDQTFDTAGQFDIEVYYDLDNKSESTTVSFTIRLYDPAINNIRYISLPNLDNLFIPKDSDILAYLKDRLVGKNMGVSYYEEVNGDTYDYIEITEDMVESMFDLSNANSNEVGSVTINYAYETYSDTIHAEIYDSSITNIRYMNNTSYYEIIVDKDAEHSTVLEAIQSSLHNTRWDIGYYEPVDGLYDTEIYLDYDTISSMFASTTIDTSTPGEKNIEVTYNGYPLTFDITVSAGELEVLNTYTNSDNLMLMDMIGSEIRLLNDGTDTYYVLGRDIDGTMSYTDPVLITEQNYYNNILVIDMGGMSTYVTLSDDNGGTFAAYQEEVIETFNFGSDGGATDEFVIDTKALLIEQYSNNICRVLFGENMGSVTVHYEMIEIGGEPAITCMNIIFIIDNNLLFIYEE